MSMLSISKDEMLAHLKNYFSLEVEACPLNALACVDLLFAKYDVIEIEKRKLEKFMESDEYKNADEIKRTDFLLGIHLKRLLDP